MEKGKVLSLEDRIPKIKEYRRRKANRRLIFLLTLFFLLILLIVYFQSPLSHIKEINVKGNNLLSENEIVNSSGIMVDDHLWKINKDESIENIKKHPEIKDVTISIQFPNSINISVEEYEQIALFFHENQYFPIIETGEVLMRKPTKNFNAPILVNFDQDEILADLISQLKKIPSEIFHSISEIHYQPKETDIYHIYLFMDEGYEITATIPTFVDKIVHYPSIISQLDPNLKGIIDFEVGSYFKAFESMEEASEKEEE